MPIRDRRFDQALRAWQRLALDIGQELRGARHIAGLAQREVAEALGISRAEVSRRELGQAPYLGGEQLALHAAAVGLRVSIRFWPVGGGLRDEGQARYIASFVARVGRAWRVILEASPRDPRDLRAVDILLVRAGIRIAVEVVSRLADLQATLRAARLKADAIGADRLIVCVAATRANREALASVRRTLAHSYEMDARRVLAELAAGRDPGRDAVVLLTAGAA